MNANLNIALLAIQKMKISIHIRHNWLVKIKINNNERQRKKNCKTQFDCISFFFRRSYCWCGRCCCFHSCEYRFPNWIQSFVGLPISMRFFFSVCSLYFSYKTQKPWWFKAHEKKQTNKKQTNVRDIVHTCVRNKKQNVDRFTNYKFSIASRWKTQRICPFKSRMLKYFSAMDFPASNSIGDVFLEIEREEEIHFVKA